MVVPCQLSVVAVVCFFFFSHIACEKVRKCNFLVFTLKARIAKAVI